MNPDDAIKIIIMSFTNKCNYSFIDNNNKSSMTIDFNIEYITDFNLYNDKIKEIGFNNLVKISTFNEFYNKYSSPNSYDNEIKPVIKLDTIINKQIVIKYIESRFNIKINSTHINNYKLIFDCYNGYMMYDFINSNSVLQNKNTFIRCDTCNRLEGKIINDFNLEEYNNYIYEISLFKSKVYSTINPNKPEYDCFTRKEKFKFNKVEKTDKIKNIRDYKEYLFNNDKLLLDNNISVRKLSSCVIKANKSLYNIAYNMNDYKDNLSVLSNDDYVKTYLKSIIKTYKNQKIKNINCNECVLIIDVENEVCYIIFH